MDRPMVVGLVGTLALLAGVMLAGAGRDVAVFWRTPSLLWVVGGVVLTTVMAFPYDGWPAVRALLRNALFVRHGRPEDVVALLVALAHTARRDGLLALERPVAALKEQWLKRPMRMAIDGTEPAVIAKLVRAELEAVDLRHTYGVRMMESAARAAPVFGMMGTLVGLVLMLGRMSDPAMIGPGMAVALLTTFYGLVLAHVVCLPIARRLAHRSSEELLLRTIALEGVLAIQAGDNPRLVEQKLRVFLPAGAWSDDAADALLAGATQKDPARGGEGEPDAGQQQVPAVTAEALKRLLAQERPTGAQTSRQRMVARPPVSVGPPASRQPT